MNTQLELDWGEEFQFAVLEDPVAEATASHSSPAEGEAIGPVSGEGPHTVAFSAQPLSDPNSQSGNPTQRILSLEQALDQCQSYIDELKAQLSDQAFLEAQLAATEEFSHIQKQAIVTLKTRLADQAELGSGELVTLQEQQARLQQELEAVQAQLHAEQTKTGTLQTQLQHDQQTLKDAEAEVARLTAQIDLSQDSAVQETQQRIIAQTTADRLRQSLRDRESTLQTLEAQLQRATETVDHQQTVIDALQKTSQSDSHKNQAIQNLSSTLLKAQTKISKLEAQTSQQAILHAQVQHSTQELEAKAQSYQERAEQLEAQVAEMQEQILHQAQQASEYETAIQHWKDRCLDADQTVGQFKEVLGYLLSDRNHSEPHSDRQLEDAIAEITASLPPTPRDAETISTSKNLKLDLPAIMHRWRHSKSG